VVHRCTGSWSDEAEPAHRTATAQCWLRPVDEDGDIGKELKTEIEKQPS
jgi:hypothetical protein